MSSKRSLCGTLSLVLLALSLKNITGAPSHEIKNCACNSRLFYVDIPPPCELHTVKHEYEPLETETFCKVEEHDTPVTSKVESEGPKVPEAPEYIKPETDFAAPEEPQPISKVLNKKNEPESGLEFEIADLPDCLKDTNRIWIMVPPLVNYNTTCIVHARPQCQSEENACVNNPSPAKLLATGPSIPHRPENNTQKTFHQFEKGAIDYAAPDKPENIQQLNYHRPESQTKKPSRQAKQVARAAPVQPRPIVSVRNACPLPEHMTLPPPSEEWKCPHCSKRESVKASTPACKSQERLQAANLAAQAESSEQDSGSADQVSALSEESKDEATEEPEQRILTPAKQYPVGSSQDAFADSYTPISVKE